MSYQPNQLDNVQLHATHPNPHLTNTNQQQPYNREVSGTTSIVTPSTISSLPGEVRIPISPIPSDQNEEQPLETAKKKIIDVQDMVHEGIINVTGKVNDQAQELFHQADQADDGVSCVDIIAAIKNFNLVLIHPRRFNRFRWANSVKEHVAQGQNFARHQFFKLYGRETPKYKYHSLQRWENAVRCFNVNKALEEHMRSLGTKMFYNVVCERDINSHNISFDPDLTTLYSLSSVQRSMDYAYTEALRARKSEETANMARTCYARGYSRVIQVLDYSDWEALRRELRNGNHAGANDEYAEDHGVLPIAVSYKAKEAKLTRRLNLLDENGDPLTDDGIIAQEEQQLTSDFVDDFRWSQLVRTCRQIAKDRGVSRIRIWVDRLVMYGFSKEEKKQRYSLVQWPDFGLLAYAVCPVVRLYHATEPEFNTDFWRKLETVLGVAGHGLFVDDYMMYRYDRDFFYGYSMYRRLGGGVAVIGGKGIYFRSVTLALATAILTDGLSVSGSNEHIKTKRAISKWKSWAIRTIGEGAYSSSHAALLQEEEPYALGFEQFRTIAFWESYVSTCSWMIGESYLDMSHQKSSTWSRGGSWNGVAEWIGMIDTSYSVDNQSRLEIMKFITDKVDFSAWTSTPGHVAVLLELKDSDSRGARVDKEAKEVKRTLVVGLARFSGSKTAHVTAIAEATGIWRTVRGSPKKILPWWFSHLPDPSVDQTASIDEENGLMFTYKPMAVVLFCSNKIWFFIVAFFILCIILSIMGLALIFIFFPFVLLYLVLKQFGFFCCWPWPWMDNHYIGEAVFDNLLMHGIFDSQINEDQYRKLEDVPYNELEWV